MNLDFYKKTHNARYYSSIQDIPKDVLSSLGCTDNVYLDPRYLVALEKHHRNIQFYYIVLFNDFDEAIAFSTIQIVDYNIKNVQNDDLFSLEKVTYLFEKLQLISSKKPLKILVSGNTFVSGERGIYIKNKVNKQAVIKELAKSVVHFVNANSYLKKEVKAYMLKDFVEESLSITNELLEESYYSFNVDPNMVMTIDEDWLCFSDYLGDMKTKFRVKAKKAMSLSLPLETVIITNDNLEDYLLDMTELYENVSLKADFNLGKFNLECFKTLKANLGEGYIIKGYLLDNKLVGFLSAMVNDNSLDAHFVGINYRLNKTYAIYQRMLYDYVIIAIEQKLSFINFGRTASEIKSSIGAVPQELTIYLRHKKSLPNKLFRLFLNKIEPTPFRQNFPFKNKSLVKKA